MQRWSWLRLRAFCALIVVCVLGALAGCASVPGVKPSVRSVEQRIEQVDRDGVDMAFDITVGNPLLNALHAPRYKYALDVAGRTLASGRAAAGADFPAAGVGTVTIHIHVDYDVLAAAYGDLEGLTEVPFKLRGAFRVPMLGSVVKVPFEHSGALPLPPD